MGILIHGITAEPMQFGLLFIGLSPLVAAGT